jgi:hypothetical protein
MEVVLIVVIGAGLLCTFVTAPALAVGEHFGWPAGVVTAAVTLGLLIAVISSMPWESGEEQDLRDRSAQVIGDSR